jgi:hypothetical protein
MNGAHQIDFSDRALDVPESGMGTDDGLRGGWKKREEKRKRCCE